MSRKLSPSHLVLSTHYIRAKDFWLLPIKGVSIPKLSSPNLHRGTQQQMPMPGHIQPVLVVVGGADQAGVYYCSLSLLVMDGGLITAMGCSTGWRIRLVGKVAKSRLHL